MPLLRRLHLVLLIGACGDSSSDGSFSHGDHQPSAASDTTGDLTATGEPTVPTTTVEPTTQVDSHGDPTGSTSTAATSATTSDDTATSTTASTSSTTATSTTSDDTTTSVDTGTTTSSTTSDDTTSSSTTSDDTTSGNDTNMCPAGSEGCPCLPGNACEAGLACQNGLCVDVPVCGDGVVEGDEACDNGNNNANTGACKLDCTLQVCGDGYTGPGEACDDGNNGNGDGCEANCTKTPVAQDACGQPSDGVWIEIDYDSAFTPTNPDWAYSPGYGEAAWAPSDKDWPYINAIGGVTIHEDQGVIGTVALMNGGNKYIRVFIGLGDIVSYDYATACVEGRSYSVGSSVTFRVENALNDCGGQGMMSNDWFSLHPTSVDLGPNCFLPGNDFQAVEIRPIGGSSSLSLKRMRFTLHGAVY